MLINETMGSKLKYQREALDLTLKEISEQIGVAVSTVQRYESGLTKDIKLPVLNAICTILELNPNWVIGKSEIKYLADINPKEIEFRTSEPEQAIIEVFRNLDDKGKQAVNKTLKDELFRVTIEKSKIKSHQPTED